MLRSLPKFFGFVLPGLEMRARTQFLIYTSDNYPLVSFQGGGIEEVQLHLGKQLSIQNSHCKVLSSCANPSHVGCSSHTVSFPEYTTFGHAWDPALVLYTLPTMLSFHSLCDELLHVIQNLAQITFQWVTYVKRNKLILFPKTVSHLSVLICIIYDICNYLFY